MHLLKFRAISESLSVVGICISLTKDLQVGFAAFPNFFFFLSCRHPFLTKERNITLQKFCKTRLVSRNCDLLVGISLRSTSNFFLKFRYLSGISEALYSQIWIQLCLWDLRPVAHLLVCQSKIKARCICLFFNNYFCYVKTSMISQAFCALF